MNFKEFLNEANTKVFLKILKDEGKAIQTSYYLKNSPLTDIAFDDSEAKFNSTASHQKTGKGYIYKYNDYYFHTYFDDRNILIVNFLEDPKYTKVIFTEEYTLKMLQNYINMKNVWEINSKLVTPIVNVRRNGSNGTIYLDFKNGSSKEELINIKNKVSIQNSISSIVSKYVEYGAKEKNLLSKLKDLFPEGFEKDPSNFTTPQQVKDYIEMYVPSKFVSTGGITGEGINFDAEISGSDVILSTDAGYRYYGKWTKFDVKIKTPIKLKDLEAQIKNYKEYYFQVSGRLANYAAGLQDYIKATGGHRGNPVWMD